MSPATWQVKAIEASTAPKFLCSYCPRLAAPRLGKSGSTALPHRAVKKAPSQAAWLWMDEPGFPGGRRKYRGLERMAIVRVWHYGVA